MVRTALTSSNPKLPWKDILCTGPRARKINSGDAVVARITIPVEGKYLRF